MMRVRPGAWLVVTIALLTGAGCERAPRPELRVDGRNPRAYQIWRAQAARAMTPDTWRDFNEAVHELELRLMGRGVTGSAAIAEALCEEIGERTTGEVIRLGDRAKLDRLETLRAQLKGMVDANARLAPKPGDSGLAEELERRQTDQRERLRKVMAEIEATWKHLLANDGTAAVLSTGATKPATMRREEALQDLDLLIRDRLARAASIYGDWPARIDRDGHELTGEELATFRRKREEAVINGHAVIPVYLRARWRIFDAVVHQPEFGPAVTSNLTQADRWVVAERWATAEAEIWARREASKESADEAVSKMSSDLRQMMKQRMEADAVPVSVAPTLGEPAPHERRQ